MKKITFLLILFLCIVSGYAQTGPLSEGFEGGVPPTGWIIANGANGLGGTQVWQLNTASYPAHTGDNAAFVNNENIGINNTEENWLISRSNPIPTDGQLRFFTRQTLVGEQNTIYQVRVATVSTVGAGNQATLTDYAIVKQWTEEELSSTSNVEDYVEKTVDLPASYIGQNVYIAFVRVYTQPGTGRTGDRWLVDDVRVVPKCKNPAELDVNPASITSTSAVLSWANPGLASSWEVEIVPSGTTPTQVGAVVNSNTVNTNTIALYNPLSPGVTYEYYVRALCTDDVKSDWIGPFIFTTLPLGSVCANPIVITTPNYQVIGGNTANYGDEFDTTQGTFSSCGATPAGTNYLAGDEVFYSYTASASGTISIRMTPVGTASTNSSIFVYNGPCSNVGASCIAGLANSNTSVRSLSVNVVAGNTYIIVISSSAATQSIAYNLLIQQENCVPVPDALTATDPTLAGTAPDPVVAGITLSWGNTGNYSSWDVAVQPLGSLVPSGAGTDIVTGTPSLIKTGLNPGTQYQYWVRAECTPGSGIYTSWAGPFAFNTLICAPANQCTYIFRMKDSASNGWNGARMQIRQNGIVVATIGDTFNSGPGPIDIPVPLCQNVPFDVYWSVAGTLPQQCILTVINSFGQTIYTKPAGTGTAGAVVYSDTVKCDVAQCNIAPETVTVANITTNSATINWVAPATTSWDIYVYPVGSPAPTASTVPTYDNVTTNGFTTTIPLLADSEYNVCVRVNCAPSPSPWTCATFATLPTCPRPTNLSVESITTTSALLKWVPGSATDNLWEILLIPSIDPPAAPAVNPDLIPGAMLLPTSNPSPYTVEGLQPATIYYYYVRTVCPGDDKSKWTGPIKFNTVTCEPADKCVYKFILTDSGTNGWGGGRVQVRQNGIIIQTLGQSITGGGPTTVSVSLCNNVPFDLFWSIEGTAPNEIGIQIQNPFTDIIYTKAPGVGTPLTVLYADNTLGNCTPPTCPKPTALAVVAGTTTQTEVQLTWTEAGTATSWEVYAVPVGSPAPVNGTPLNTGIANYYLVTGPLPYTLTGLLPGTAYIYYVRAICSDSDISTWTILNPKTFTTKPVNDECEFSTVVPVNPTRVCVDSVNGSTLGATRSLPNTSPVCTGNTDDDIWYSFVATAVTHIITFSNVDGTTTDINHTLYHQGADCTTMTQLYCSNPNISVAVNLVIGDVYKIRLYTNGGNAAQSATFNLCITTPEPIANDECAVATVAAVNTSVECTVTTHGSLTGASASVQPSSCAGTEDDDVWFKFTANSTIQLISFIHIEGTTDDLVHSVYSGNCDGGMTLLYCSDPNESTAHDLVVGQIYYVRVWSKSNILQDITFDLCIGKILPPIIVNNTTYTNEQLVRDVLVNSECAQVSNITFSTDTVANGLAYFERGLSEFPFQKGVVLTTGNAMEAPGPNTSGLSAGSGAPGVEPDLAAVLAAQGYTDNLYNPTVLEFDFVPLTNFISFNFIFASEEYGIYQCQFSDAFAFLLTNTVTNVTTNLAVIPSTDIPVSVTTIRDNQYAINPDQCDSAHPELFANFYGENGINPIGAPINFNGMTVPLVASSVVVAGTTYHIKLVIADYRDASVDSAVFLEKFKIGDVDLGQDLLQADGNAPCNGEQVIVQSDLDPAFYTFTWSKDGEVLPGQTGPNLVVTTPGVYTIKADYNNSTCSATDNKIVEFFQDIVPGVPVDLINCNASGTATFNLKDNEATILAPYPAATHNVAYFLSETDAKDNIIANAIATPETFAGANNQVIYVRINNLLEGCYQIVSFTLIVQDHSPQFTLSGDMAICPEATTTISVVPTANNFDPALVTYVWTYEGTVIASATTASLVINGEAEYGSYTVTVNRDGCTTTSIFTITNSNTNWDVTFVGEPYTICKNQSVDLVFTADNFDVNNPAAIYTWTKPDGSQTTGAGLSADQVGAYTLGIDILGCTSLTTVNVAENTTSVLIDFVSGCDSGDFIVTATPSGGNTGEVYTYSWTGPVFEPTDLPGKIVVKVKGTYAVTITTPDGCQTTESTVLDDILCDVQRGISPNGDGKNEDFDLSTLNVRHLSIFNRYGTEVYQYDNYKKEWHGQSNTGEALPDSTYFYVIDRGDGKTSTGWIYINR